MNAQEALRQAIDAEQRRLRASVPAGREAATLAVLGAQDRLGAVLGEPAPDLVTGHRLPNIGGGLALRLCLDADEVSSGEVPEGWGERFLDACGQVAAAEMVLAHCETGFMRLVDDGAGALDAWIATKRAPTRWRERADVDWWASWLATRHAPELLALRSGELDDAAYCRLAGVHLATMAWQPGYPPDAVIDGLAIRTCRDVLQALIAWALRTQDRGEALGARSERDLVAKLAADFGIDPVAVTDALAAFTLDRENAAWHAAVPGVAAAPLVSVGPDRIVWSLHGLTSEPLLFLSRELRRRDAQSYHNAAFLREDAFRQELYALFADRRFVTSPGRIVLRRDKGDVRTDVDAVVFDRKTGTLGLFELKSQDPFARSTAELTRQRDNILYANRQVAGALDWLKRHGGDDLLNRVDTPTAKKFRVQKVFPFVLGRYLAHFDDGPVPDRRAAWATWPGLLRLLDGQPLPALGTNPIASLFTRLANDGPSVRGAVDGPSREIDLGAARLTVHASYAAYQVSAAVER